MQYLLQYNNKSYAHPLQQKQKNIQQNILIHFIQIQIIYRNQIIYTFALNYPRENNNNKNEYENQPFIIIATDNNGHIYDEYYYCKATTTSDGQASNMAYAKTYSNQRSR